MDTYDEITKFISTYLKLTFEESDIRQRKVDPEAYLLYLKAVDTLFYFSDKASLAADSLIRKSIALDPTYAPSQATLSMTTLHKGLYYGHYTEEEAIRLGKAFATKAVELDPKYYGSYMWLSNWSWHERKARDSERYMDSLLKYSPNNPEAISYVAFHSMRTNKINESLNFINKSLQIDPKHRDNLLSKMMIYNMMDSISEALETFKKFVEFDKEEGGNLINEAYLNGKLGNFEKALTLVEKEKNRYMYLVTKEKILYDSGRKEEADVLLEEIINFPNDSIPEEENAFWLSIIYANRGNNNMAFENLEKAFDILCVYLEEFFVVPEFKNLYDDPRWDELLEKLGKEFDYDFKLKS